jgi:hypothetical protein
MVLIGGGNISDVGAMAIADAIVSNKGLEAVYIGTDGSSSHRIDGDRISDLGAEGIAQALRVNSKISALCLSTLFLHYG